MELVEQIARALCERHIRMVRRHDTEPEKLEAMLPDAVDYSWRDFIPDATVVMPFIAAERERCAVIAKTGWVSADYNLVGIADADQCMALCEHIEAAIRSQP